MTTTESFERFQYFNFETNFLKNEILFQKTRVRFLVGITRIENATFPFITALSEPNFKTIRMGSKR